MPKNNVGLIRHTATQCHPNAMFSSYLIGVNRMVTTQAGHIVKVSPHERQHNTLINGFTSIQNVNEHTQKCQREYAGSTHTVHATNV